MKAFLVAAEIAFLRTHDIEALIGPMPKHARPSLTVGKQRRLTDYATVMRYPGPYNPATLSEAKEAVKLARRRAGKSESCFRTSRFSDSR